MKRFDLGICLLLLFFACSCKKNNSNLSYDTFDSLPTVSLEDVFEPITYIPLQSNDSSIVSNVLKVCMSEDSFYILSVNPYKISKFDREGNFISNISREGRSEGEYLTSITVIQKRCFTSTMLSRELSNIKLMVLMIPPYL